MNPNEVDYKLPKLGVMKWILFILFIFIGSIFLYFPILSKFDNTIRNILDSNPSCKISFSDYKIELFFPKIKIFDLQIPKRCFSSSGGDVRSKITSLHFHGFSFSPFGPHFKVESDFLSRPLTASITLGLSTIAFNVYEQIIELKDLHILNPNIQMQGQLQLSALVHLTKDKITKLKFHAFSKNLKTRALNISGFQLNALALNDFLLKADSDDGNTLMLNKMIIGDVNSPIRANFSGTFNPNYNAFVFSKMDLNGEVSFSPRFLDDYSIIGILMNKFDKKDDFYQIQIQGTPANPIPTSPRK